MMDRVAEFNSPSPHNWLQTMLTQEEAIKTRLMYLHFKMNMLNIHIQSHMLLIKMTKISLIVILFFTFLLMRKNHFRTMECIISHKLYFILKTVLY